MKFMQPNKENIFTKYLLNTCSGHVHISHKLIINKLKLYANCQ